MVLYKTVQYVGKAKIAVEAREEKILVNVVDAGIVGGDIASAASYEKMCFARLYRGPSCKNCKV